MMCILYYLGFVLVNFNLHPPYNNLWAFCFDKRRQ